MKNSFLFQRFYSLSCTSYNGNLQGDGQQVRYAYNSGNRMVASASGDRVAAYYYDHSGARVSKVSGYMQWMRVNGQDRASIDFNGLTQYPFPHVAFTREGYYKYYFAGSERLAVQASDMPLSGIGARWNDPVLTSLCQSQTGQLQAGMSELFGQYFMSCQLDAPHAFTYHVPWVFEAPRFFHTDHLGSSSWMTDITGTPVLHLQYLPFGEPWVRQINWNYALLHGESRYTFTGKERDEETGLMYFGARYYDPGRGIFTQVDPLHGKYPYQSPFVYCANNPLRVIDPWGLDEWEVNQTGHIRHVDGSENKPDKLFAVSGKKDTYGTRITNRNGEAVSMSVDKEVMNSLSQGKIEQDNGKSPIEYSTLNLTGQECMGYDMLSFMSTNVSEAEWTLNGYAVGGMNGAILSTSHIEDADPIGASIANMYSGNNGLRYSHHTHPYKAGSIYSTMGFFPSNDDKNARTALKVGSPNAIIGIMHKGTLYNFDSFKIKKNNSGIRY